MPIKRQHNNYILRVIWTMQTELESHAHKEAAYLGDLDNADWPNAHNQATSQGGLGKSN